VKRDPKQALELLKTAAEAGNARAGLRLVSIYRDGRKGIINRSPRLAKSTLDGLAAKLPATQLQAERLIERASELPPRSAYDELQAEFDELPGETRSALAPRMRRTNFALYTYLVQAELERLGLYKGAKNGTLSRATVNAIYSHCIRYERAQVCRKGPTSQKVVEVTAKAFQNRSEMAEVEKKSE
jgi:hypothetical protein